MNSQKSKRSEQLPSKPEPPTQDDIDRKKESNDSIDEASRESFPASDSPAWSLPAKRKKR